MGASKCLELLQIQTRFFNFLGFKFQSNFLGFIFQKGLDSGFRFGLSGPFKDQLAI